MRKNIIISILNLIIGFNAFAQNLNLPASITADCVEPNEYCIPNPSITGPTVNDPWYTSHNLHTCLGTQPRATYVMFQIAHPGDLLIYIQQFEQYSATNCAPDPNSGDIDVDFACWGPFPGVYDKNDFMTKLAADSFTLTSSNLGNHRPSNGNHNGDMGGYPVHINGQVDLVDCSYHSAATEWCFIPNAQLGDWYLLMICNYTSGPTGNGIPGYFSFTTLHSQASGSMNYVGSSNCDLLNCLDSNNPTPCEGNEFTLYCTMDPSELPSNPQFTWNAPDGTTLATTNTPSYTLVAETSIDWTI